MKRMIIKCVSVILISVLLLPSVVSAHSWQDGYCDSNYDDCSHTHY